MTSNQVSPHTDTDQIIRPYMFTLSYIRIDLYARLDEMQRPSGQVDRDMKLWCSFLDNERKLLMQATGNGGPPDSADEALTLKLDKPIPVAFPNNQLAEKHARCVEQRIGHGMEKLGGDWCVHPETGRVINLGAMNPALTTSFEVLDVGVNGLGILTEPEGKGREFAREIIARLAAVNPASESWFFSR